MSLSYIFQTFRVVCLKQTITKAACVGYYSSKEPPQGIIKEVDPNTGTYKSKKTYESPKITLISGDSVSVTTLEEASKLSKRRDLKLVKVVDKDIRTERAVYQLMTGAQYLADDLKQREKEKADRQKRNIKGEKVLLINSRIALHDLDVQLRKALKWINKLYEVRVIINGSGSSAEASEKIYTAIEQYFKSEECDAKLVQKRCKGSDIKFQIVPPRYKDRHTEL